MLRTIIITLSMLLAPLALSQTTSRQTGNVTKQAEGPAEPPAAQRPAPSRAHEALPFPDMMSTWEYAPQEWK